MTAYGVCLLSARSVDNNNNNSNVSAPEPASRVPWWARTPKITVIITEYSTVGTPIIVPAVAIHNSVKNQPRISGAAN